MTSEDIEQIFAEMDLMDRSKPEPPSLSDMPIEIIEEITGNLNVMDRLVVRKVSRYLLNAIDKTQPEVEQLFVELFSDSSLLHYGYSSTNIVKYSQVNDKCVVECGDRKHVIEGGDHMELSINDLAIVMKNPKLRLEVFTIHFYRDVNESKVGHFSKHLKSFFESLNHQIHTEDVLIRTSLLDAAMSILPFLKPGTLKRISLFGNDGYNPAMEKIVELEQWKQAKILTEPGHNLSVSIGHVFCFNKFNIKLQSISHQDAIKIRDVLLRSPNFKSGVIWLNEKCKVVKMERVFKSDIPRDIDDPVIFKVPDSDNVFEVHVRSNYISIDKIFL